jgi:hypothetical protein
MSSPGAVPVRLGHLVPQRVSVVVCRTNPLWLTLAEDDPRRASTPELVDVILQAYVFGPRCPGVIKAELAAIEESYLRALNEMGTRIEDAGAGTVPAGTSSYVIAWHTFLRDTICVMVPGLTTAEADVLAAVAPGDTGPGTDLLQSLGIWRATPGGATPDPEALGEGGPPTTEPSSPSSPRSTDSVPLSS